MQTQESKKKTYENPGFKKTFCILEPTHIEIDFTYSSLVQWNIDTHFVKFFGVYTLLQVWACHEPKIVNFSLRYAQDGLGAAERSIAPQTL